MKFEIFSFDGGDIGTIINSGYVGTRLVVFEDPAYNISVEYLSEEIYEKMKKECISHKIYEIKGKKK